MPKVLQNFLIGVGLDTENYDAGAKKVESSLGRMRSLVGLTGAAIAGAFAAAGAAAIAAGQRVDQFALVTEGLKTSPQYIYDYGRALAALGGNADDAVAAIKQIETAQSNFKIKGMLGPLEDVALTGADISALSQTTTGKDFLRTLAPMVQNMDKDRQRQVQDALGLSDSVMRSLRGGLKEFDASIARAHDLAGNFDQATEAARGFYKELAEFGTRMEGVGNTLAEKVLPGFTGLLQSMNGFLDGHKDGIARATDIAGNNPVATSLMTGGAVSTAAGVALRGIGLRAAGTSLMRLGYPGMIAGGGLLAYDAAKDWDWGSYWQQSKNSASGSWRSLTGQNDLSGLPDAPYGSAVPDVAPGSIVPRDMRLNDAGLRPLERTPIYSGGEVSHAEATQASPDVVMIKDQRDRAQAPAGIPPINVQNNLDMKVELDGRQLESKITDVIQRRERDTRDDITSTVDR